MTYDATVEFKFDSTYTHDYNRGFASHLGDDDFIPEQHFTLTAPAHDLTTTQMFKLFEKFMLAMGYSPNSIMSGAMSLVFNDMVLEEQQRIDFEYLPVNQMIEEALEIKAANLDTKQP